MAVARQVNSSALLAEVRIAFTSGMDTVLIICGGIAIAGALLAVAFLPRGAAHSPAEETRTRGASDSAALVQDQVESVGGDTL